MTAIVFEDGSNSDISIVGDEVIKLSRTLFDSYDDAARTSEGLTTYADLLADEPLRTAELRDVAVVSAGNRYRV